MKKIILFLLTLLSLSSCNLYEDWIDPENPYDEFAGRMIERVRMDSNNRTDYIYYSFDRRGRITAIENTFYNTIDKFGYTDDLIVAQNNIGDDRDIMLDWSHMAEEEIAYRRDVATKSIVYDYLGDMLNTIDVEEYNSDGSVFSTEEYEFDFDYDDNLYSITRSYDEYNYYIDSTIEFTEFSYYENYYNIDILSIMDLYIDDDFASRIGRTGGRSRYLPTRAVQTINRNGRREVINYRISYTGSYDKLNTMTITSSNGGGCTYYISYLK